MSEDGLYLTAAYQFCRHLEQNGLFDRTIADEGYRFDLDVSPQYRETTKVYNRSGASSLLGDTYEAMNGLAVELEDIGCIVRDAGESSLATGFWRGHLADAYEYDSVLQEGWYSVPETYIPSINLASETYERYRNGKASRDDVVERVVSTTDAANVVDRADFIFDNHAGYRIPRWKLLRVLHAEVRFTTAVDSLSRYVEVVSRE